MAVLISNPKAQSEITISWSENEAVQWFKKGLWLNGLNFKPHKSVNKQEFAKQYHKHQEWWDQAFAYLKNTDLKNVKPGKYLIDGENVFAIIAEADKKDFAATKWESHQKYQDIQLVIKGKEKIGIAPITSLSITTPYEDAKDVAFYTGEGKKYLAAPGTFFIFFPCDGHRPDIRVKGTDKDKKIVIKIKTE